MIQLAGALGLDTVAEGIENEEQADRLRELGYTLGQGYHLARPMPAEDFTRLLAAQRDLVAATERTPLRYGDGHGRRRYADRTVAAPPGWTRSPSPTWHRPGRPPGCSTRSSGGATAQGWRVYRRAPERLPAAAAAERQLGARRRAAPGPARQPIAVEVDRLDRRRTVDKLLAEAAAGRVAIWVRWGTGPFAAPPAPVHLVTREAARSRGRWHTVSARPAPRHSGAIAAEPEELPWDPA